MIVKQDIIEQLSRFLDSEQSAGELQEWLLVESRDIEQIADEDTQDLVYSILHPIFDCHAGAIDAARLELELRKIADHAGHVTSRSFSPSN